MVMRELFEESIQKISTLSRIPNEKEWNIIATLENLLSTESMKYISGMSFEDLCKKVRANI